MSNSRTFGAMSLRRCALVPLAMTAVAAVLACSSSDSQPQGPPDTGPACGPGASIPPYTRSAGTETTFPAGFLFGAASAGMQIEKGLTHADWYHWAKVAGHIENGANPDDGPDSFAHIDEDVQALVDAGANAYRFSIE